MIYTQKNTSKTYNFRISLLILCLFIITNAFSLYAQGPLDNNLENEIFTSKVTAGADRLFSEYAYLIKGKNIALVSNHTGILSDGTHLADALSNYTDANLKVLFGMHFNIRSNDYSLPKDEEDDIDDQTGLPKYSLYGERHKPTKEMLKNVDVIIFDIQEVGARFYEHINILGFVMEAASENAIDVIVLDRPNPITGIKTDGFITDDEFLFSFGAFGKLPVIHGMTMGEIAKMYNGEKMFRGEKQTTLHVVEMLGWKRDMWLDETGLKWIKPSPNLPDFDAMMAYTGTCLFEGINVSAGRGTDKPFQYIGAPWIDNSAVVNTLNKLNLPGAHFESITFTSEKKAFHSREPYLANERCQGIYVTITDRNLFNSYRVGISMLWAIHKIHPKQMNWNQDIMNRLVATTRLEQMIYEDKTPSQIFASWEKELNAFNEVRTKYLLY
ncbi:exo-beta-N-acetylmuramidase NamZ family protein [Gelidibacter mesophilus]|uniref:exo-beta-N-acetylmuramidase NamZ family protein n=1 Tax=Gelidibacter mesophilus TaxID=169050 RepID=UPI0004198B59|nr:DUF1343 domain-containing protein [Gelidibacter mesophilus]